MTDREAMKLALENICGAILCEINPMSSRKEMLRLMDEAIAALHQALEQPEIQPCAGRNCGSTNPNLHSAECFEDYERATGMNQRKPLTPDQIFAIADQHPVEGFDPEITAFVRAIEAAHGITGEKK